MKTKKDPIISNKSANKSSLYSKNSLRKKTETLLIIAVIISASIASSFLYLKLKNSGEDDFSKARIEFTVMANRTIVPVNESFEVNFSLMNAGYGMVRLVDLSHGYGLYLIVMDSGGDVVYDIRPLIGSPIYGNESLTELSPGNKLEISYVIKPPEFGMSESGIYELKGIYSTFGSYQNVIVPHWEGELESNEIEIEIG